MPTLLQPVERQLTQPFETHCGQFSWLATIKNGLDDIRCDVQQVGGGPRGFVAAEFLEPAISPDESVAVGPDRSAERAGLGDFDARGTIPCPAVIGQPMGA